MPIFYHGRMRPLITVWKFTIHGVFEPKALSGHRRAKIGQLGTPKISPIGLELIFLAGFKFFLAGFKFLWAGFFFGSGFDLLAKLKNDPTDTFLAIFCPFHTSKMTRMSHFGWFFAHFCPWMTQLTNFFVTNFQLSGNFQHHTGNYQYDAEIYQWCVGSLQFAHTEN